MLDDVRKPESERRELIVEPIKNENGFYTGYLHKGELVRCKECKWFPKNLDEANSDEDYLMCPMDKWTDADDYCSYGERKESE